MADKITEGDLYTLIGHAEYLRRVAGQTDMPAWLIEFAERLAVLHVPEMRERLRAMRAARPEGVTA